MGATLPTEIEDGWVRLGTPTNKFLAKKLNSRKIFKKFQKNFEPMLFDDV